MQKVHLSSIFFSDNLRGKFSMCWDLFFQYILLILQTYPYWTFYFYKNVQQMYRSLARIEYRRYTPLQWQFRKLRVFVHMLSIKRIYGGGECWLRGNCATQSETCCKMCKRGSVGIRHESFENSGSVLARHLCLYSLDCTDNTGGRRGPVLHDFNVF